MAVEIMKRQVIRVIGNVALLVPMVLHTASDP
jgi:hypothetical protein